MANYECYQMYDRVVAKSLQLVLEATKENQTITISPFGISEVVFNYCFEIVKMASHISGKPFYLEMEFFPFLSYKLKNRKKMKKIKHYTKKIEDKPLNLFHIYTDLKENFKEVNDNLLEDIYEEYYKIK